VFSSAYEMQEDEFTAHEYYNEIFQYDTTDNVMPNQHHGFVIKTDTQWEIFGGNAAAS